MEVREPRTTGAWACLFVPRTLRDARGHVASPYREAAFRAATGGPLFPVRQANRSRSRRRGTLPGDGAALAVDRSAATRATPGPAPPPDGP